MTMCSIRNNGINISRVIVAVNVGWDDNGTYYVSDEKQQGVHWALLALDLKNNRIYYGDSLGWPGTSRAIYQIKLEKNGGINIMTSLENTTVINKLSDAGFISSDSCKLFYPLQSCSWCYCCVYGGSTL